LKLETAVIFVLIHLIRKLDGHTETLDRYLKRLYEHARATEDSVARLCQCMLPIGLQDAEKGSREAIEPMNEKAFDKT